MPCSLVAAGDRCYFLVCFFFFFEQLGRGGRRDGKSLAVAVRCRLRDALAAGVHGSGTGLTARKIRRTGLEPLGLPAEKKLWVWTGRRKSLT